MRITFSDENYDGLDVEWWEGSSTFHIMRDGTEVDVFTHYGDDKGNPPDVRQALRSAKGWFRNLADTDQD